MLKRKVNYFYLKIRNRYDSLTPDGKRNVRALSALAVLGIGFGIGLVITGSRLGSILGAEENSFVMPGTGELQANFNDAGYDNNSATTWVLADEVTLGAVSSWWNPQWAYQKQLTITNNSNIALAANTTVEIKIDTQALVSAGKMQANCADIRVAHYAGSGSHTELVANYDLAPGATDCSNSTATSIYFSIASDIAASASTNHYYLYYGNSEAAAPTGLGAFDIGDANATFVCPFDGRTTCIDGETPTTATGAIRDGEASTVNYDGTANTATSNQGVFIEEGTTNKVTNPSFENADYDKNWTLEETTGNITTAEAYNTALAEGRDIVINGGFDSDTVWIHPDWTIAGGVAHSEGVGNSAVYVNNFLQAGKTYKVTYTVSNYTSGGCWFFLGGTNGTTRSANGTYTEELTASSTAFGIRSSLASPFIGDIDNIIVIQTNIAASSSYPGSELLTDGNMEAEDTSAWSAGSGAILSKEIASPHSGNKLLRITKSINNNSYAVSGTIVIGKRYRVIGYGRSDGQAIPAVYNAGSIPLWTGQTSTNWQKFELEFTAQYNNISFFSFTNSGGTYSEFDDISVTEANPMNGSISGATVNVDAGVDLGKAYSFDGVNDYVNMYSPELNSAFNPEAGTLLAFAKVSDPGVWTDGQVRYIAGIISNSGDGILICKYVHDNKLAFQYYGNSGGSVKAVYPEGQTSTDFQLYALTWDKANDEFKTYINGIQIGATQVGLGTIGGNLLTSRTLIGASFSTPSNVWKGDISAPVLLRQALTAEEIADIAEIGGVKEGDATGNIVTHLQGLVDSKGGLYYPFGADHVSLSDDSSTVKFGSKSAKINTIGDTILKTSITPANTNNHTLSAYINIGGGAVNSSSAVLYFDGAVVTPGSYEDKGGGWWRLTYTAAATADASDFGVQIKSGVTAYVDGVQLEEKGYPTTYADGSLGTGYSWSGTVHESQSSRTVADLKYASSNNYDPNNITISFWFKPNGWSGGLGNTTGHEQELLLIGTGVNAKYLYFVPNGSVIALWENSVATLLTLNVNETIISDGEWHHVVVHWSMTQSSLTINSSTRKTGIGMSAPDNQNGISIGYSPYQINSTFSDLRMFDRELTESEIASLYKSGLALHGEGSENTDRFVASGAYTTPALDLGPNADWSAGDDLVITQSLNGGTISYQTVTSQNNVDWSSWQALNGAEIQSASGRYIKVKANFSTANQSQSPTISGLRINYVPDATPPTNPTKLQTHPNSSSPLDTQQGLLSYETGSEFRDQSQDFSEWAAINAQAQRMIIITNDDHTQTFGFIGEIGADNSYIKVYQDIALGTPGWLGIPPTAKTPTSYQIQKAWNNDTTPAFSWPEAETSGGASDTGEGASGVKGYHTYFGADNTAIPYSTATNKTFLTDPDGTDVNYEQQTELTTNGTYYLRIQAEDNAGNYPGNNPEDTWQAYVYNFENTAPVAPQYISVNPSGYTRNNDFTFTWPAGSDADSGIWGYCYKAGEGEEICEKSQDLIDNDKYAKALTDIAYQPGTNVFYVRAKDHADNYSNYTQVSFYWNPNAPSAPVSVSANPETGCFAGNDNCWSFSWNQPLEYTEEVVKYYYSINQTPDEDSPTVTSTQTPTFSAGTKQGENIFYVVAEDVVGVNFGVYGSVTFEVNTIAPGIPKDIIATDSSNRDSGDWALTVQWDQPDEVGSGLDSYNVYRSTNGTDYSQISTTEASGYLDTDLSNQTTYYYKVSAEDNAGAESGLSAEASYKPTGKYSSPPNFGGVPVVTTTAHTATVQWTTDREADSYVEYGLTGDYELGRVGDSTLTTTHKVIIRGLNAETQFHFRTQSIDDSTSIGYPPEEGYSDDFTFETQTAPDITNVSVSDITLSAATITWKTTTISNSEIRYGKGMSYDKSIAEQSSSLTTNHTVRLTNLDSGSLYNFKIIGKDVDGAEIFSDNYVFETIAFPQISSVRMEATEREDQTGALISWQTNVNTSSIVQYYPKNDASNIEEAFAAEMTTDHEIFLNGLKDSTTYMIVASGRDVFGNLASGESQEFTTALDTKPPKISNLAVETAVQGLGRNAKTQIIVSWETNEPATSQVEYGIGVASDSYASQSAIDTNPKTNHIVIISDLEPSTPYHVRAVTSDAAGNTSYSSNNTIVTRMPSESAIDLIINSLRKNFGWAF